MIKTFYMIWHPALGTDNEFAYSWLRDERVLRTVSRSTQNTEAPWVGLTSPHHWHAFTWYMERVS